MSDLKGQIIADHESIRSQIEDLRMQFGLRSEEQNISVFSELKAHICAQMKAEEFSLYAFHDDPDRPAPAPKLHLALLQTYEEHDLITFLLSEMGQAEEELTPRWRAQLGVLADLLDRHFKFEESSVLPAATEALSATVNSDLLGLYRRERDEIFAKRTGRRPLISVASVAAAP